MKTKKKRKLKKSVKVYGKLSLVLLLIVFFGVSTGLFTTLRMLTSKDKTLPLTRLEHVYDNDTMDSYQDLLITDANGARYAGRIWSDKTVTNKNISLQMNSDGIDSTIINNSEFLTSFSALGSSQVVNEYPPNPIDLVLVLDVSSSMFSGDDSNSRISLLAQSADEMITKVLSLNQYNRVAVILFDDNAYTLVPLDHYEIAKDSANYTDKGFVDKNPGVGSLGDDGAIYVQASDTLEMIEYSLSKYQGKKDIYYNFLAVEKGYPGISGTQSTGDWGEAGAYYWYNGNNYGEGRNFIFKYKPDPTRTDDDYNKDKYDGDVKENHDGDADAVTILSRTQGGTCIQCGYWLGFETLADADTDPVSYTLSTGEKVSRERTPVFVLLSDGASNITSDYSTWWAPSTIGEDTKNTFSSNALYNKGNGTGTSEKYNEYNNWRGEQTSSDTLAGMKQIMTAAYWKKVVDDHYSRDLQVYTIGVGLEDIHDKIGVNPTEYLAPSSEIQGQKMEEKDKIALDNIYELATTYVSGGNPRYVYLAKESSEYMDDYTFFHPGNLTTTRNQGAYGIVDIKSDHASEDTGQYPDSAANTDPSRANYFWRRYSVLAVDTPKVTIMDVGTTRQENPEELLSHMYYGNSKIESLDAQGYRRLKNVQEDYDDVPNRNAANISLDESDKTFFAQYDMNNLDDLRVNDRYFDINDDGIESAFTQIYELIQGQIFEPIQGENDSGINDAITYSDPIGLYMDIKDDAVKFNDETYDMAILLFGELHGIVKTAVYDFKFNDEYMKKNDPEGQGKEPMKAGWYTTSDPQTAQYIGPGESDGSWDAGNVYYLDYKTALDFLPTVEANKVQKPEDLPDDQKYTKYTFYRFAEDSGTRNQLRWNPSYGKTPEKFTVNDLGAYKLSDIRIWIEDSEDYQTGTQSTIDTGYDMSLQVNLPVNALPLQVATITMDEHGVQSYETNLSDKQASTPFRLFYGVGIQESIFSDDELDIDVAKISQEYIKKYKQDDKIYLYSNYYSNTTYDGYVTDTREERSRGDAALSFSANSRNRFYAFQKTLELHEVIDSDQKTSNGSYEEVKLATDEEISEFKESHPVVKDVSQLSNDKWYYIVIDYYMPDRDKPMHVAVSRKGAEFGEGIASSDVESFAYLCWYSDSLEKWVEYTEEKPSDAEDYVIATRPGGLRTGDLAQSRRAKDTNVTGTANNYFLPTISSNSTSVSSGKTVDNIIINDYLGNNGRVAIEDTTLLVGKQVDLVNESYTDDYKEELYNFDITINNREGDQTAIKIIKNPYSNKWQLRVSTIDVLTNNQGLLQNPDNTLTEYEYNGKKYYVYIGENNVASRALSEWSFRIYSAPDNGEDDTLIDSGITTYVQDVNAIPEESKTDLNQYKNADDQHPLGSIEFWIKDVKLIPIDDDRLIDPSISLKDAIDLHEFVITTIDSNKDGVQQESSAYLTRTTYLTEKLFFGYTQGNKPASKPDTWPQENWDKQVPHQASITLKDGEGILLAGLDASSQYTIKENVTEEQSEKNIFFDSIHVEAENSSAYKVTGDTITGRTESGVVDKVTYVNRYYSIKPTDLTIEKEVQGSAGEKDKDWEFTITLTGSPSTLIYDSYNYDGSAIDGVTAKPSGKITFVQQGDQYQGTITLKHGQSVTIKGLPVGTAYSVSEKDANKNDYITRYTNQSGTLEEENPIVKIQNIKYSKHDLKISKEVSGDEGEQDKVWNFDVILTPDDGIILNDSYATVGTDNEAIRFVSQGDGSYKGTFTLKHGQSITIKGLPENVSYQVIEKEADTNRYITKVIGNASGKLVSQDMETIQFINSKYSLHNLTIDKKVSGSAGDQDKVWTFQIKLTPANDITLNDSYPYVGQSTVAGVDKPGDGTLHLTNSDGSYVGTITLKHGQSITIQDIPYETLYEVTEMDANTDEYKVSATNNKGSLIEKEEKVSFVNTKLGKKDLTIRKEVVGDLGSQEKSWTFTVSLTPDANAYMKTRYAYEGSKNGDLVLSNENGVYTGRVTLKSGEYITIKDIPELTQYSIREVEANTDGYTTTTSGNTDGVLNGETPVVKFTNTKLSNNTLTIVKEVQGSAGDKEREWTFKITLKAADGIKLANSYNYIGGSTVDNVEDKASGTLELTEENGAYVGTVTLKHGQSLTINDLPGGTSYKVEEIGTPAEYIVVTNGNTTDTLEDNMSKTITFINKNPSKHNLTISKIVTGGAGDKEKKWTFEVTLTPDTYVTLLDEYSYDGSLKGTMRLTKQADGTSKGTITLKSGESITIKDLPELTQYSIREVEANTDGYTTKTSGKTTGVLNGETPVVQFTNTKLSKHDLTITKIVEGNAGDIEKEWTFKVTLKAATDVKLANSYDYIGSHTVDEVEDKTSGTLELAEENGAYVGTVTLKHGQSLTIKDIPEGTQYKVEEVEANTGGYITSTSDNVSGTLNGKTPVVEFYNKNYSQHNLKIMKIVQGDNGELDKLWTFQIKITPNENDAEKTKYHYLGENMEDGTIEFVKQQDGSLIGRIRLKSGQSITIEDISYGSSYEVIELEENMSGYTTTYQNNKGIIEDDAETIITNERKVVIPNTFDNVLKNLSTFVISLGVLLGSTLIFLKRYKKKNVN